MKFETLDRINGFSLALLAAMPIIRSDILAGGPVLLLIFPSFLLIATGLMKIYSKGTKIFNAYTVSYFYLIIVLFVYLIISASWNVNNVPVQQDILKILFLLFIALSVIISFNKESAYHFLKWIIIFAVFVTAMLFYQYLTTRSLRGYLDIGYLAWSQLIGMGAITSFSMLLFYPEYKGKKAAFITVFLYIGLAASLARGSLIVGVGLAVLMTLYYFKTNRKKSYSLTEWFKNKSLRILGFFSIGFVILAASQIERTAARFLDLLGGSLGGRENLWGNSIIGFLEAPLIGYGLGNSGMISVGRPDYYPHNLFLQVLVDGGIFPAILLIIICIYPVIRTYSFFKKYHLKSRLWIPVLSMYVFLFAEYFKSSNFYESRVFIAVAILLVIVTEKTIEKRTSSK